MKMSKIFSLILVVVMLFSMTSCDSIMGIINGLFGDKPTEPDYKITVWVSEVDGVAALTKTQIDAFAKANNITIEATIEGVSEGNAAGNVLTDVASAPDLYCFAQDQLARLVQASALAAPSTNAAANIRENSDADSVAAASVAGKLWAYPLTSDNGYYLYYDTSIISAEDADSLEDIIAACENNGKTFRYALENSWYTASFFFATGCVSDWTINEDGKYTSVNDTFNSPEGLVAMKGMQKLAQSPAYDSNADIFTNAGAIVTGIWNANAAEEHFGANLGATDLPSFTVDGETYHLGSFKGCKLMGVKPQTDPQRQALLHQLAQWLTNEENQLQRAEAFQWGPSNKNAQNTDLVKNNPSIQAISAQNVYATPQGQIHGSWWDLAKVLGAEAKAAKTDEDLQAALEDYKAEIDKLFQKSDEELRAWSVIGSICGTNWDTDISMTEVSEGVWETAVIELNAGEEFKCRQGGSWDANIGSDGKHNGPNCVVDVTGSYIVRLTLTSPGTGNIELIPQ